MSLIVGRRTVCTDSSCSGARQLGVRPIKPDASSQLGTPKSRRYAGSGTDARCLLISGPALLSFNITDSGRRGTAVAEL